MIEVYSFGVEPITCHAFNNDRTRLALSPNNNEVHIHHKDGNKGWTLESVLSQHDLRVSAIDWAPKSNRIVTCSADRNAYVWNFVSGSWKPTLVLLRINRAATCVRWSPNEDKFAVGSGAKLISVCYFEESNDWWVSKHVKKQIKSTITCLDWHPNNILLASGSTDFKVRIFSSFIKEVDGKDLSDSIWGPKSGAGGLVAEFAAASGSWIHSVAFSPDGKRLAWAGHDSSISVVDSERSRSITILRTRYLPCLSLVWSSSNSIIAAGHDCCPLLFKYEGGQMKFVDRLDKSEKKEADGFSAMRKFRDLDRRGIENHAGPGDALDTIHQNTVVEVRMIAPGKISTVSLDGKLVVWEVDNKASTLNHSLGGLRINS